jgi:N-acetylglucosaminyldiphosphoundecaprenol N-acetyl-beta-D-mannosaminyltransferase
MLNKNYRINILGCPVDNLTMQETISLINEMIAIGGPHQHVAINADKLLKVRGDAELECVISSCSIINADGKSIIWLSKILGKPLKERIAGIDLMKKLITVSSQKGYKLYFLGAKEDVVKKVVEHYRALYPELQIAGFRNGYWDSSQEKGIIDAIRNTMPDILFVAISSPKKELLLKKYLDVLQVPFVMGVGGSFDIIAGKTKRASKWMQKIGFEWLFRLIQEPRRLWRRYLIGNTIFIILVLKTFIRVRILKKNM